MPKNYLISIPLALLPILFFTNPELEKHRSSYHSLFITAFAESWPSGDEPLNSFDALNHASTTRMKTTDYRLFSLSYVKSIETGKIIVIGAGILGQVISLSSPDDLRFYFLRNKRLTGELEHYNLDKNDDSPFGWRVVVTPQALGWLGIN